ncbi:hypothetical protein D3C75_670770 [compost metagenome]
MIAAVRLPMYETEVLISASYAWLKTNSSCALIAVSYDVAAKFRMSVGVELVANSDDAKRSQESLCS